MIKKKKEFPQGLPYAYVSILFFLEFWSDYSCSRSLLTFNLLKPEPLGVRTDNTRSFVNHGNVLLKQTLECFEIIKSLSILLEIILLAKDVHVYRNQADHFVPRCLFLIDFTFSKLL